MQTRRQFLRHCSLAIAAAGIAPAALAHQPMPNRVPVERLGLAQFRRQLNSRFAVQAGGTNIDLVLVRAAALTTAPGPAGDRSFSLRFHGPVKSPLPQDTYVFDHPNIGRVPIFIVPVGPPQATPCEYEAVFNRMDSELGLAELISRAPKRAPQC